MDIKKFKKILEDREKELKSILLNRENEINGISRCEAKDDLDFASYSTDLERESIIYKNQRNELIEINYALNRIKSGIYGICEMCDCEINEERLLFKPYARYCIECKSMIEKGEL